MVKLRKGPSVSGPSSSLGIMRFFDSDTSGPKMSPELIVVIALALIVLVLVVKSVNPA
jgi:preprotein translocase subunit Sec61beta